MCKRTLSHLKKIERQHPGISEDLGTCLRALSTEETSRSMEVMKIVSGHDRSSKPSPPEQDAVSTEGDGTDLNAEKDDLAPR